MLLTANGRGTRSNRENDMSFLTSRSLPYKHQVKQSVERKMLTVCSFAQQWKGGVCHGSCRLMVGGRKRNGAPCDMAGLKMINAYYELKNKGCSSCGTKRFKDGCELRMAYEWNCNRW